MRPPAGTRSPGRTYTARRRPSRPAAVWAECRATTTPGKVAVGPATAADGDEGGMISAGAPDESAAISVGALAAPLALAPSGRPARRPSEAAAAATAPPMI